MTGREGKDRNDYELYLGWYDADRDRIFGSQWDDGPAESGHDG